MKFHEFAFTVICAIVCTLGILTWAAEADRLCLYRGVEPQRLRYCVAWEPR